MIHVDVMDGVFVPNISIGFPVIEAVGRIAQKPLDVHLMIEKPERYLEEFALAGADIITFHLEAAREPGDVIYRIHDLGKKAGVSVKPATPIKEMIPYADLLDMLLVMTVEPGFGGQSYIPESTERIRQARGMADELGIDLDIQVDGGVGQDNVHVVLEAGANVIVSGSAVFHGDITDNVKRFIAQL